MIAPEVGRRAIDAMNEALALGREHDAFVRAVFLPPGPDEPDGALQLRIEVEVHELPVPLVEAIGNLGPWGVWRVSDHGFAFQFLIEPS